ncbi:uncharacterized protein LOC127714635 [Mytilus californianus]|uniref:uncharacterized protein LOC127714635 n=1 Tax=Mytilus californianus TaxID=6549 RepID=UPI002247BA6F|nr:uncharacterized protein LOC127714635 [Mytilus californianus]
MMDRTKIKVERDVWENSFVEQHYNKNHGIIPHTDPKEDPKYNEKNKLIRKCQKIVGTNVSGKPPLNIAIVGTPGGGKSSLLNTIFASFSTESWTEIVPFGSFGRAQRQRTTRFKSYVKDTYYKRSVQDAYLMPTFLDMTGFEDDDSEKSVALLELLCTGRIKEDEELRSAKDYATKYGAEALLGRYNKGVCHRPVDRIIVVCTSNLDVNIPESFLNAVWKASTKHREIPVYGVLTCRDKYPPNVVEDRIKSFRHLLALPKCRFAHIINYCDAIDSEGVHFDTTIPSLDVPVLQFMKQVLNPRQDDPTQKQVSKIDILAIFAFIFAVVAFIYVLLISNR